MYTPREKESERERAREKERFFLPATPGKNTLAMCLMRRSMCFSSTKKSTPLHPCSASSRSN